jgi:hypothetical protein
MNTFAEPRVLLLADGARDNDLRADFRDLTVAGLTPNAAVMQKAGSFKYKALRFEVLAKMSAQFQNALVGFMCFGEEAQ